MAKFNDFRLYAQRQIKSLRSNGTVLDKKTKNSKFLSLEKTTRDFIEVEEDDFIRCILNIIDKAYLEITDKGHSVFREAMYDEWLFDFHAIDSKLTAKKFSEIIQEYENRDKWSEVFRIWKESENFQFRLNFTNCLLSDLELLDALGINHFFCGIYINNSIVKNFCISSDFVKDADIKRIEIDYAKISNFTIKSNLQNDFSADIEVKNETEVTDNLYFDKELKFKGDINFIETVFLRVLSVPKQNNEVLEVLKDRAFIAMQKAYSFKAEEVDFFGAVVFEDCDFLDVPRLYGSQFFGALSFRGSVFANYSSVTGEPYFRYMKNKLLDLRSEQDALIFHSMEMEARRKTYLKNKTLLDKEFPAKIAAWFLKHFNDYGRNYFLPFILLFLVFLISFQYISLAGNANCYNVEGLWIQDLCNKNDPATFRLNALYASKWIFGPLGFVLNDNSLVASNWAVSFIAFVQVLLSSIFWYLIIVQFRRQFKL